MAGLLDFDSSLTIENQAWSCADRLVCGDAYQEEASQLFARFISAREAGFSDLLIEIECEIGAFVCHLAHEVEAGDAPASVLEFYNDQFSEMAR